jgi:pimeloyl-ACP methyl ester carboxylesterase
MAPHLRRVRDLAVYDHCGTGAGSSQEPLVVLVHGAMDRGAGMLRVARRLRHLDLVRYDRRGYGRSRGAGVPSSFQEHVDDLDAIIGDRQCILLGHSYGGVVSMALASSGDERVVGVVSYEAPRAWEEWWSRPPSLDVDPAYAAEVFLRRMIGDTLWEALPERTRSERRSEGQTMVAELNFQTIQRYDATRIDVPLIVGVGRASSELTHRAARLTASEAIHGELMLVEGAGHGAHTTNPEELAAMVDYVEL